MRSNAEHFFAAGCRSIPKTEAAAVLQQPFFRKVHNMKLTDVWSIQPLADEKAVIRGKGWRITVLTDRLFRLEEDADERFCDTATQAVLCRRFPLPAFTVSNTADSLIVETEAARLVYDKKPFSSSGLSVTLKGAYSVYASIWHYGDAADTLKGTARTLDNANGAIPLDEGLMSMKGYAVLDDSSSMGMDEQELYGIVTVRGKTLHIALQTGKSVDFAYERKGDTLILDKEIILSRYALHGEKQSSGGPLEGTWVSKSPQGKAEFRFTGENYVFSLNGRESERGSFRYENGLLHYTIKKGAGIGKEGRHNLRLQGDRFTLFQANGSMMEFQRE